MSDDLKKKLEAYENGELSPEQAKEVEKELEMIEKSLETTDEKAKEITPFPDMSIDKQQKIMEIIAAKKDEALHNASIEELQAMLANLD